MMDIQRQRLQLYMIIPSAIGIGTGLIIGYYFDPLIFIYNYFMSIPIKIWPQVFCIIISMIFFIFYIINKVLDKLEVTE